MKKKNPLGISTLVGGLLQSYGTQGALKGVSKWAGRKKGRKNPGDVEGMSEKWHGRKSQNVTEVEEIESYDEDMAELADLEELGVLGSNCRDEWNITFKKDRPKLACDGDGENLEIIGGDQELVLKGNAEGMVKDGKKLIPLGWLARVVYETDKHHLEGSNGYPESYEHYFGEEYYKTSGVNYDDFKTPDHWFQELKMQGVVKRAISHGYLPMLIYNQTDTKLLIVGGKYKVEDVGIKD
jgi:hypothetical protein